MRWKAVVSLVGGLALIIGIGLKADDRYMKSDDAATQQRMVQDDIHQLRLDQLDAHRELREYSERRDLSTRMRLNRMRLLFLLEKHMRSADDLQEIEELRGEMTDMSARIRELDR